MNAPTPQRHSLVLLGHGARDARWAEPFERLRAMLVRQRVDVEVRLAYLDLMTPPLPEAIAQAVAAGSTAITVIPVFFGQGGHVRRDLPALIAQCQARHPDIDIRCAGAAGEDDGVLHALAEFCLRQLPTLPTQPT